MSSYYSGGEAPAINGVASPSAPVTGNNWHANHAPYSYHHQHPHHAMAQTFPNEYYQSSQGVSSQYQEHYNHYTKYQDYYRSCHQQKPGCY